MINFDDYTNENIIDHNSKCPYTDHPYRTLIIVAFIPDHPYRTLIIGGSGSEKKHKVLIVFDDIIADMINNKKLDSTVTELFIRGRKLISIVFFTQSYFKVPKDVRLKSTHFFIMKIPNKRELQQIPLNHSSDIDFKDFMKIY